MNPIQVRALTALFALALAVRPATTGFPVIDPSNLAQAIRQGIVQASQKSIQEAKRNLLDAGKDLARRTAVNAALGRPPSWAALSGLISGVGGPLGIDEADATALLSGDAAGALLALLRTSSTGELKTHIDNVYGQGSGYEIYAAYVADFDDEVESELVGAWKARKQREDAEITAETAALAHANNQLLAAVGSSALATEQQKAQIKAEGEKTADPGDLANLDADGDGKPDGVDGLTPEQRALAQSQAQAAVLQAMAQAQAAERRAEAAFVRRFNEEQKRIAIAERNVNRAIAEQNGRVLAYAAGRGPAVAAQFRDFAKWVPSLSDEGALALAPALEIAEDATLTDFESLPQPGDPPVAGEGDAPGEDDTPGEQPAT